MQIVKVYIKVPSSLNVTEYEALYGCELLEKVELCEGLEQVEMDAFWGCESLQYVKPSSYGTCKAVVGVRLDQQGDQQQMVMSCAIPTFIFR